MTTFEEYMKMPYKLEIIPDADEGGFVASYPELPGCITCGETLDEAVSNALDAKKAWVLAAMEDPACLAMVVCFLVFLVNDLYGFLSWRKMQRRQEDQSSSMS